ncbi:MAG: hemerythrin family protein [Gammaproteobacteria bacterium]|nr:hemerythrin family protein [Gammaproteobacteria bacterium]
MFDYSHYHFEKEEALMFRLEVDSRHFDRHRREHQSFLEEIGSLQKAVSAETPRTAKSILKFLTRRLTYHILGSDQNMSRQVAAIQEGKSPSQAYEDVYTLCSDEDPGCTDQTGR